MKRPATRGARDVPAVLAGALLAGALLACAAARAEPAPDPAAPTPAPAPASRLLLPSAEEGPWLRSDRALHFAASLALSASWRIEGRDRAAAIGLSLGAGVAKEIYDAALKPRRLGRGASRKDLVADLLGAAAGVLLLDALDR